MKTSLFAAAVALALTVRAFAEAQGYLNDIRGIVSSFGVPRSSAVRQSKETPADPSMWNMDGLYKSIFKLRDDPVCPDSVQIDNSVTSTHLSTVAFGDIKENGVVCRGDGSWISYSTDFLGTKEGMAEAQKKYMLKTLLEKNPGAKRQLNAEQQFGQSRLVFDRFDEISGKFPVARWCGEARAYTNHSFYFNIKGGVGNVMTIGSSEETVQSFKFEDGQHGLLYLPVDTLNKYRACILRMDAPPKTAPPKTTAPSSTSAAKDPSTLAAEEEKTTMAASSASSTQASGATTVSGDGQDKAVDDKKAACFPGSASVELESGQMKQMEDLQVGERVLTSVGEYSVVFGFTHKISSSASNRSFVRLAIGESEKALLATSEHYLYLNGDLKAAGEARVGDVLMLGNGKTAQILRVSREMAYGLYNPQTLHGDIVVDGVVASTYTRAVDPRVAHAGLSLARTAFNWFGAYTTVLEGGSELTAVLPQGDIIAT